MPLLNYKYARSLSLNYNIKNKQKLQKYILVRVLFVKIINYKKIIILMNFQYCTIHDII
jgi:hypothetical protein